SRFRTTAATATLPSKSSMPASACTRRAISSKVAASTWALICGAPPAGIDACGSPPRSQLIKVSHHSGTFRNHSHTVLTWPLIHGAATSLIQARKPSTTPTVHVQAVDTAPSIHGAATSLTHVKKASTFPTTQFQTVSATALIHGHAVSRSHWIKPPLMKSTHHTHVVDTKSTILGQAVSLSQPKNWPATFTVQFQAVSTTAPMF